MRFCPPDEMGIQLRGHPSLVSGGPEVEVEGGEGAPDGMRGFAQVTAFLSSVRAFVSWLRARDIVGVKPKPVVTSLSRGV